MQIGGGRQQRGTSFEMGVEEGSRQQLHVLKSRFNLRPAGDRSPPTSPLIVRRLIVDVI